MKQEKTHWEKKQWEKPTVHSLSVKGTTLGGDNKHVGESSDPAYKKGWSGLSS